MSDGTTNILEPDTDFLGRLVHRGDFIVYASAGYGQSVSMRVAKITMIQDDSLTVAVAAPGRTMWDPKLMKSVLKPKPYYKASISRRAFIVISPREVPDKIMSILDKAK
jgi:hypothetical protein